MSITRDQSRITSHLADRVVPRLYWPSASRVCWKAGLHTWQSLLSDRLWTEFLRRVLVLYTGLAYVSLGLKVEFSPGMIHIWESNSQGERNRNHESLFVQQGHHHERPSTSRLVTGKILRRRGWESLLSKIVFIKRYLFSLVEILNGIYLMLYMDFKL